MIVYDLDSMNNEMPFLYCSTISLAVQIFWFVAKPISSRSTFSFDIVHESFQLQAITIRSIMSSSIELVSFL